MADEYLKNTNLGLNKRLYLKIFVAPDGPSRFLGTSVLDGGLDALKGAAANFAGRMVDVVGESELLNKIVEGGMDMLTEIQSGITTPGSIVSFSGPLLSYPDIRLGNSFSNSNALGSALKILTDTVATVGGGGMTPNLSMQFMFPQMWEGTSPLEFSCSTVITQDTVSQWRTTVENSTNVNVTETVDNRGIWVMNAVLAAMMMVAPRRVISKDKATGIEFVDTMLSTLVAGPPILDVAMGPIMIPTVQCKDLTVKWSVGGQPPAYDRNGLPLAAELDFSFISPMIHTQSDWDEFRINLINMCETIRANSAGVIESGGNTLVSLTPAMQLQAARKQAEAALDAQLSQLRF